MMKLLLMNLTYYVKCSKFCKRIKRREKKIDMFLYERYCSRLNVVKCKETRTLWNVDSLELLSRSSLKFYMYHAYGMSAPHVSMLNRRIKRRVADRVFEVLF